MMKTIIDMVRMSVAKDGRRALEAGLMDRAFCPAVGMPRKDARKPGCHKHARRAVVSEFEQEGEGVAPLAYMLSPSSGGPAGGSPSSAIVDVRQVLMAVHKPS